MKKVVFVAFLWGVTLCGIPGLHPLGAQQKSTVETRALIKQYTATKSVEGISPQLRRQLAVGETIGVIAQVNDNFDSESLKALGITTTTRVADIVVMHVPPAQLATLESCAGIVRYTVSHRVAAPTCDQTRYDTGTDEIQAGHGVPSPFDGEGVLVGITDWGFDYRHPNINSTAERRIARAWDQYRLSGPAPAGFNYGTELVGYDQLTAALGDTSNIYDYGSHGTHVAGIIGGRGTKIAGSAGSQYIGQAPRVRYLLGSWLLDEASWMDQVAWMRRVAAEEGKRLVINSSWGMYTFSTLDGTSLLSQAINHWSDSGTVFVTSGGNNAGDHFHLEYTFDSVGDTLKSMVSFYSGGDGQALIYWGMPNQSFQAGIAISVNRQDTILLRSPMFNTAEGDFYGEYTFVNGEDTIPYSVLIEQANPFNNRPHALICVDKKQGYNTHMFALGDPTNTVHVWNVDYEFEHMSNVGAAFSNAGWYGYKNGNDSYGIGEPACADKAIAVAAHGADRLNSNDSTRRTGDIASFSSHGPTLDGRNKPEISAPGVSVISSINSRDDAQYTTLAMTNVGGVMYRWSTMSGTSMSGPAVTGIVALMLQANPNLSVDQIRDIIFSTARNDDKTGDLIALDSISPVWGHGKIDGIRCVNAAYDLLDIEEARQIDVPLTVYPNPTVGLCTVLTGTNLPALIEVFSTDGHRMLSTTAEARATLDMSTWARGYYIVRCTSRTGCRITKVIKH